MMRTRLPALLTMALVTSTAFAQSQPIDWSSGVAYSYDSSGNIKTIGADTFLYDGAGRLIQATTNGVTRTYTYDEQGNRTNCSEASAGDCQNGITVNPATNRVNGASYDAAGNLTAYNGHAYAYDTLQMQTGDAGGPYTREYLYTADDERIAVHNVGGGWTWSVRDTSGKVLREFTSNDNATSGWQWTKDYVYRDGLLLATRQREPGSSTPTSYHYHLDHLGTPRRITTESGQTVGIHDYHSFGSELSGGMNEPASSLMKFTGHERDLVGSESASTLDYMHARYYNPSMGRFLSVDPVLDLKTNLRNPQGWNRYAYAINNPIRNTDPTGKYICDGMKQECKALEASLSVVRAAAAEAKRNRQPGVSALNAVVAYYGKAGEKNGVNVEFGKTKTGGFMEVGRPGDITVDRNQFAAALVAKNYVGIAKAMAHEGNHSLMKLSDPSLVTTRSRADLMMLEQNGYRMHGYINAALDFDDDKQHIWKRSIGFDPAWLDWWAAQSVAATCALSPCTP
jgi:RHS repeat-associated protein